MNKKFLTAVLLSAFGLNASASSYQGLVSDVFGINGSIFILVTSGGFDGPASTCPASTGMWYRIDPSTGYGRSLVAIATAAKLSSRLVYAAGDGVCGTSSGFPSETLIGLDLKG